MYPIQGILVAVKEPDSRATPALAKAAALAKALDTPLQLFHCLTSRVDAIGEAPAPRPSGTGQQERCCERLESLALPLRRRGINVITSAQRDFPVHEAIIRAAIRFEAGLIVVSSHATPHRLPRLLHYPDWELLRASSVPVLIVKSARPYRQPKVLAAVDPSHGFGKPATLDAEILRYSATIAAALHGSLHAVHAYTPSLSGLTEQELCSPEAVTAQLSDIAATAMATLRAETDLAGIEPTRVHVVGRHPVDAIAEEAHTLGSGIVALGSISRPELKRFFMGNTAEALLDRLDCDLLIVKPPNFPHLYRRDSPVEQIMPAPRAAGPF
jgi:universal stress protein E